MAWAEGEVGGQTAAWGTVKQGKRKRGERGAEEREVQGGVRGRGEPGRGGGEGRGEEEAGSPGERKGEKGHAGVGRCGCGKMTMGGLCACGADEVCEHREMRRECPRCHAYLLVEFAERLTPPALSPILRPPCLGARRSS